MPVGLADAVKYVLARGGCMHPFRVSRVLALAEIMYRREKGGRLVDAVYVLGPGVFYIEGFKEMVEGDECFEVRKGDPERGVRGCVRYVCGEPPRLPGEAASYLDRALEKARGLSDMELNDLVVNDPVFREIAKRVE